ncbi:MAG: type II toxin-antitoxin system VapC family toxin [Actinomycetota bacterium]
MAPRLLLDTHAFVWWVTGSDELSTVAIEAIRAAEYVDVSLVTLWEIVLTESTKHPMIGTDDVGAGFADALAATGFSTVGIEAAPLAAVQRLEPHHIDPFDRLLVAQARALGSTLVTRDRQIQQYEIRTLW